MEQPTHSPCVRSTDHGIIRDIQRDLYGAYKEIGQPLTWDRIYDVEAQALIEAGGNPDISLATARKVVASVEAAGVNPTPTFGKDNPVSCPEVEEFGRLLVHHVRDDSIHACDATLWPVAKGAIADRWRKLAEEGSFETMVRGIIPDIVDEVLFRLLLAMDHKTLKLKFTAANGKTIDPCEEEFWELGGLYMSEWIRTHSQERYIDDGAEFRKRAAASAARGSAENSGSERSACRDISEKGSALNGAKIKRFWDEMSARRFRPGGPAEISRWR